jgi:hypothetical protein
MALGYKSTLTGYAGQLFIVQPKTTFLNSIGGLNGGKRTRGFNFVLNQNAALVVGSDVGVSETVAAAATTPTVGTRSQVYSVCTIIKSETGVSWAKESSPDDLGGVNVGEANGVPDEMAYQKDMKLKQMAIDIEWAYLFSTYVAYTDTATASKMRGVITEISTNTVAAGGARLSKDMIDALLIKMFATAPMIRPTVVCGAYQAKRISDIYGYGVPSISVGGVAITQIVTPFGNLTLLSPNYNIDQYQPATLSILDLAYIQPVFCPHKGGQILSWTDKGAVGAADEGWFYTQTGVDYGYEAFHGKITGLATS